MEQSVRCQIQFLKMLKLPIKAGNVQNLTDARYFAAWEVQWMGFQIASDATDTISPLQVKAIKEWVTGPLIAGEFGMEDLDFIREMVQQLELQAIQLGRFADLVKTKNELDVTLIQQIVPESPLQLDEIDDHLSRQSLYADHFLLDFALNGISWAQLTGEDKHQLERLRSWNADYDIIWSFADLNAQSLADLEEKLSPQALQFVGGEEEKTGIKSFEDLDDLFELLEDPIE